MNGITQSFIGTTEEWQAWNPRLYENVWAMELLPDGKRLFKVGMADPANAGMTLPWNELPYFDENNIAGLPGHLRTIEAAAALAVSDAAHAVDVADATAEGLEDHTTNYENPHEVTAEQLGAVKLVSPVTQILDSDIAMSGDIAMGKGKKFFGTKANGAEAVLAEYAIYNEGTPDQIEQVEIGSETEHLNLNTDENGAEGNHITVDTKDPVTHANVKEVLAYQSDVQTAAAEAASALAAVNAAKIDKAVAGDTETLLQDFTQKDDVATSLVLIKKSVNVMEAGNPQLTEMPLRLASEEEAGIMPAESFVQVKDNTQRIDALENKSVHYPVSLSTATPTQEELQAAYGEISGNTGDAYDMTSLDDLAYGKTYTWYESQSLWVDRGSTIVAQATNDSLGVVKGAAAGGKIFIEADGSMSVNGWDDTQAAIDNQGETLEEQAEEIEEIREELSTHASAIESLDEEKAPINNPTLTGEVNVPTLDPEDNSTQAANTAWVRNMQYRTREVGTGVEYHHTPTAAELVMHRHLPLEYQIIQIALYQDLCDKQYCGDSLNASADWWYKCNASGTRSTSGLYMRVEDARGLFHRGYGANAVKTMANGTPYNGGAIGSVMLDRMQNITGKVTAYASVGGNNALQGASGAFSISAGSSIMGTYAAVVDVQSVLNFSAANSPNARTGNETAGVSEAVFVTISY